MKEIFDKKNTSAKQQIRTKMFYQNIMLMFYQINIKTNTLLKHCSNKLFFQYLNHDLMQSILKHFNHKIMISKH